MASAMVTQVRRWRVKACDLREAACTSHALIVLISRKGTLQQHVAEVMRCPDRGLERS